MKEMRKMICPIWDWTMGFQCDTDRIYDVYQWKYCT